MFYNFSWQDVKLSSQDKEKMTTSMPNTTTTSQSEHVDYIRIIFLASVALTGFVVLLSFKCKCSRLIKRQTDEPALIFWINAMKNADIRESVSILILLCLGAIILMSDTTTLFLFPCVSLHRSSPFSYVFVFLFCFFNQNKKTRTWPVVSSVAAT